MTADIVLGLASADTLVVRTVVAVSDSLAASRSPWSEAIPVLVRPDSLWVARTMRATDGWMRLAPLMSPFIAVLLASLFSMWQTTIVRREQKQTRRESAFSLFLAITSEMRIILHRTWEIVDSASRAERSRSSIHTAAKDACLAELIKLMPWEPALGLILHFYENVSLIAVHQNNAVHIPEPMGPATGNPGQRASELDDAIAFAVEKYPSMFMQYDSVWRTLQVHARKLGRELPAELRPVPPEEFERRRQVMGKLRSRPGGE